VGNLARRAGTDSMTARLAIAIRSPGRSNWRVGIKLDATSRIETPKVDQTGIEATDSGFG